MIFAAFAKLLCSRWFLHLLHRELLHCRVTNLKRNVKFRWRRSRLYSTTLSGERQREGYGMFEVSLSPTSPPSPSLPFSFSLFSSIEISLIDINDTCRPSLISKRSTCIGRPYNVVKEWNKSVLFSRNAYHISVNYHKRGEPNHVEHNSWSAACCTYFLIAK